MRLTKRLKRLEARVADRTTLAAEMAKRPRAFVAVFDAERPGAAERLIDAATERFGYVESFAANRWPDAELGPRTTPDGWLFNRGTFAHEAEAQETLIVICGPGAVMMLPGTGCDGDLFYAAANGWARADGSSLPYPDYKPGAEGRSSGGQRPP